jgi:hypothetical protein
MIGMRVRLLHIILIISLFMVMTKNGASQVDSIKPYQIEKVFPNPIEDHCFVDIEADSTLTVLFELIDILGQPVQKWEPMEVSPGFQRIKLKMNAHHSGIYLLKARIREDDVIFRVRKG